MHTLYQIMNGTLAAPSAPPLNVSLLTLSSTTIYVSWDEVPAVERNGIITRYQVNYSQTAFTEDMQTMYTTDLNITLQNLHEYTTYTILVRAFTSAGAGPYSNETVTTTFEDSKYYIQKYSSCLICQYLFRT